MRTLLAGLGLLVATLLAAAPPARAATLTAIELQKGSRLQEVAFDATGTAWATGVNVLGRPALFRVAPDGTVTRHDWSVAGTVTPEGIVVGQDGLLYVCLPADAPIGRPGAIYQVSPASGEVLQSFELTSGTGQGDGCWDLARGPAGSGRVYFTGRSSTTVGYVVVATGERHTVSIPGSGLHRPYGITVGPDGRIWFTIYEADDVASVDPSLGDLRRIALAPGARPRDITPWTDGALWVTEERGSALTRVGLDGAVSRIPLPADAGPNRIVSAPDGTLWFSAGTSRVGRLAPGGTVSLYQLPAGAEAKGPAIGPGGTVWFAGEGSGVLYGLPLDLAPALGTIAADATAGRATVTVDVDARGVPSTLAVDLGATTAYGATATADAGAFDGPARRAVTFDGLAPGTYHFRVRAQNAFGERIGADQTIVVPATSGLDTDGDGIPDDVDCADDDPDRHQGRREIPGNRVDEDCDGRAQPFPRLGIAIEYAFEGFADGVRVKAFRVTSLPARSRIRLICRAPSGRAGACPFTRRTARFRKRRSRVSLLHHFDGRRMPFGTRLELRVSAPRRMGAVRIFRLGPTRVSVKKRCLPPGRRAPVRCGAAR